MAATMERKGVVVLATVITLLSITACFCPVTCHPEELSPTRILSEVERRCVLVLFMQNKDVNGDNMELETELHQILTGKKEITFGTSGVILRDDFNWPNGQPLKWVGRSSKINLAVTSQSEDGTSLNLIAFQRRKKDRTCLITGPKVNPKAEQFTGTITIEAIIKWVNAKCNMYISSTGGLAYEGIHRESILQNVFRMSCVSNFTMRDFDRQSHWARSPSSIKNVSERAGEMISTQCKCESYDIWNSECGNDLDGYCSLSQSEIASGDDIRAKPVLNVANSETSKVSSGDFSQDTYRTSRESIRQMPQCERLSTLPTKGQFFYDYLKTSKPVIIEGVASHWDAFHKWTMEFLRERYGDKDVHIKLAPDGLFEGVDASSNWEEFETLTIPEAVLDKLPFPDLVVVRPATMNIKFSEFLDMISNVSKMKNESNDTKPRASAYLEYSSIPNYLPELEQDVEEFPFVRDLLKRQHLNIWLSDGNTLGKLHFDPFDNFLCQIRGTKQLTLFEPHENTKMYEGHVPEAKLGYDPLSGRFRRKKLLDSTAMVMAPVDILDPDFQRFPAFAETRPLNCTIHEGDVLFMPAFWWHEVQSYPNATERRNLAVNFWYEPFLTKEFPCAHCKLDVNPLYRHLL